MDRNCLKSFKANRYFKKCENQNDWLDCPAGKNEIKQKKYRLDYWSVIGPAMAGPTGTFATALFTYNIILSLMQTASCKVMRTKGYTKFTIERSQTINCFENKENPNQYINDELSKISEWLTVNKLSLNASKTKFMVFSMPQKKVVIPRLKFADTEI